MIRNLLLCLFLQILITLPAIGFAKTFNWTGIAPELRDEIKQKFPSLITDEPSLEDIDRMMRHLMGKGTFEDVQVLDEESHFVLQFHSLKSLNRVVFNGMASFDSNDIVQMLQLEQGQKFDSRILNDLREKIKTYYIEQGFLNINADIKVNDLPNNLVDILIYIQEGAPVRVNSIYLDCPNKNLENRLKWTIKRNLNKIYNPQLMASIPKQLQEYFRDHAYIRANVVGPEVHMDNSKTGVDLTYHIERTEQYSVLFEGNYLIPTPRLVSALDLPTLSSANPNILPELLSKLKEFYWKKGYARVDIKGEETVNQANVKSTITFHVNEGVPIKIEDIEIQGNVSQPEKVYRQFLEDHSGDTISRGYFHRNDFEQGLKNLLTELQNRGYLKAKLISSRYLYNKAKDKITISVNLDEGPLTRVNKITFTGLKQINEDKLRDVLQLKTGEALELGKLEQSIQQIKSYCQERGYLEFRILNEKENLVQYTEDNTQAHIDFIIEEGPQVRVASIIVDGNNLTKEYVLRKEVEFKEGEVLTPSKIEESTKRLQKLSIFNSVEIKTLEQRTQIADRTVIIKVSERPPGLFNVGAGVTNEREFTLRGFAGIAYRNIGGTARAISTRAEINYNVADIQFPEMKLTAGYLEPYILDSRSKGRVNFTRAIQVDNYESKKGTDSYQFDFLLEQNLTSHMLFTYDLWSITQLRSFIIDKDVEISKLGVTQYVLNLAWTGPLLEIDYRDHPFNPTTGTLTRMQLEYSNPFLGNTRSIEYLRATSSFTHYYPFRSPNPIVLANSFRVGNLVNLSNNDGVPFDKKGFILGGLSTIRGFEAATSESFPSNRDLHIGINDTYLLKDHSQFFLIKSELRFPIWGSLGGAIFYDGGLVKVDQVKFKDPYRDAAGFGFRYATPVGPANIEFAWKLDTDRDRGEEPFRLHISIGTF